MVYCQKCGTKNVDDANFCVNCGTEITRASKEEEKKPDIKQDTPKRPGPSTPPPQPLLKLSSPYTPLIAALIVAAAIIISAALILTLNPSKCPTCSDTATIGAQEFDGAVYFDIDFNNSTCYGNILGANNGDILKITGDISELVRSYDENLGEYTSIVLNNPYGANLLVHCKGNITNKYNPGDQVEITTHISEYYGLYNDLWGGQWALSGEFMEEVFIDGKLIFELLFPQSQIKKI